MKTFNRLFLSGMLCYWLAVATAVKSEEPGKPREDAGRAKSLNAQLLDGLAPRPAEKPSAESTPDNPDTSNEPPNAAPPAGDDLGSAESHPLAAIGERMRSVEARIAQGDTSGTTQALQRQIIDELAKLVEQANKKDRSGSKSGNGRGSQSGSVGGNPTPGPPQDSANRLDSGEKERVDTADVQDVLQRYWGHLPEKMREQMQSTLSEEFLPKYQRVIEEYYKRLAEDRRLRP